MRSSFLHILSGMVLASVAVMVTGCSQDTLNSDSQNLNMAYTPSPSGAGRFTAASFTINKMQALPAEPAEAALYGTEKILFRFSTFTVDLTRDAPATYTNIALSVGTYNVTHVDFTPPSLVDEDLAPPPYATCEDGISTFNAQSTPGIPRVFQFNSPPDDLSGLTFTVQPGQTSLAMTVDVPGLIADYQASFTCQLIPCPGCPVDPKPKLTAFDTAEFRTALLANIKIK